MKLIDGKNLALNFRQELKQKIKDENLTLGLAIILANNNEASEIYVRNKVKACEELGIKSQVYRFSESDKEEQIIALIQKLNQDHTIDGIIVQSPVFPYLNEDYIMSFIAKDKDVDGFGIENMGALALGKECLVPATPLGIIKMLEHKKINLTGKNVVVVGRSKIVGRPMGLLLLNRDATVTYTHSKTNNLKDITSKADILIVAVGKPKFITKEYVKEGAIVIDVGINRINGKLCGDVDFEDVLNHVSLITPVPGGVGPMTIAMLLNNLYEARKLRDK